MNDDITTVLPYLKDLGLPVVALYYLFKVYQDRVKKGDEREDRYAAILESHNKNCGELSMYLKQLAEEIHREGVIRQELLSKLVDKALGNDKDDK